MSDASENDALLIQRLKFREPQAVSELYDRYGRITYALILRIVRDQGTAEDLVQETFLRIWTRVRLLDENHQSLAPWVLAVARNLALDYLRSRQGCLEHKFQSLETIEHRLFSSNAKGYLFTSELARRLRTAFGNLTAEQRQVIEPAYYEGVTQSEMAERLHKPLGTIKSWVRNGLKVLRDVLSSY